MFECDQLIHPFQNAPGVSQQQRAMADLLSEAPEVDGRSLADLLNYFVQLSPHVNYYDSRLNISDWQPFFQKSTPFVLAGIIKFDQASVNKKIEQQKNVFNRHPSKAGLQLFLHYFFQKIISPINTWHLQVKGSGLPAEQVIEKLIKDNLREPMTQFICNSNMALKYFCIKPADFRDIAKNDVWGLNMDVVNSKEDCKPKTRSKRSRLIKLRNQLMELLPSFLNAISIIGTTAGQSLEQSLFPLKEELQKKHTPHLGLLFAFLKLFQHLQGDLNTYTKKHLDFFYKQVLKMEPRRAKPDKAHIVFEIQKQLDNYLLKKGLLVKDGKDTNKAEILFGLDDEIVVNKTQVADKRTLFINNQNIFEHTYVEGVYMAPDADKADGLAKDFKDNDFKSFDTTGAKLSKYTDPEKSSPQPYPNARMGFILASPVLLLNEGKRTIEITIACRLNDDSCKDLKESPTETSENCCEERLPGAAVTPIKPKKKYPDFIKAPGFYDDVVTALNETWYYVSEEIIVDAVKKGISKDLEKKLRRFLTEIQTGTNSKTVCYCPVEIKKYDTILNKTVWDAFYNSAFDAEKIILQELFKPRKALQLRFSGEKDWITSLAPPDISISPALLAGNTLLLKIRTEFALDQPAITFYDKEKLKEDFNTTLPLVKIELDDKIKLGLTNEELKKIIASEEQGDECCLLKDLMVNEHLVSLYHFFRNVVVIDKVGTDETRIDVSVCGLKNFIVQNDESVQDVNGPVYPFGTRPDIIDFSVVNPIACITQAFINDAVGISPVARNYLQSLLTSSNGHKKSIAKNSVDSFLNTKDSSNNAVFTVGDKSILKSLFGNPAKKYCLLNQTGPSFFIGSNEVFGKKWNSTRINLNWKDKPANFRDYYNAYIVEDVDQQIFGLDEGLFKVRISVLQNGNWKDEAINKKLFDTVPPAPMPVLNPLSVPPCQPNGNYTQGILLEATDFPDQVNQPFTLTHTKNIPLKSDTRNGFIKFTLQEQDFLHKDYAYVLARQMMALGKYPDQLLEGAVYRKNGATVIVFRNFGNIIRILEDSITHMHTQSDQAKIFAKDLYNAFISDADYSPLPAPVPPTPAPPSPPPLGDSISDSERDDIYYKIYNSLTEAIRTSNSADEVVSNYQLLKNIYSLLDIFGKKVVEPLEVLIPNEPWTPIIKNMSLDYTATATNRDIDLIHLYPYDGTYKKEQITLEPSLFPSFCDEGNLFIGLKDLQPGSNVNMLFQLAEATADSESEREDVAWYYLDNNQWKALRTGFEVLDDATDGLTTSGIIKFALPENMTKDNTILPKDLHWIKAAVPKNSMTISETIGIYTQAVRATFTNEDANDKLRLSEPLAAGKISRLEVADPSLKKLSQPFDSFDGAIPEEEGRYYVRVSELLRHKGRAIQKFDYERLVLEEFPKIFKVKCINHSFALDAHQYKNDFPVAPGYVLLAVIPDLNQLKAAQTFEPRVPVSMLEAIEQFCRKHTSPFVRFRAMNPRYEKVHFCLKIKLITGKDENYYKSKLQQDLREFMAPWAIGEYDKLRFGQCLGRSEVIQFLETRDYVNYIIDLTMRHDENDWPDKDDEIAISAAICPKTPRSILIAGHIDICIPGNECEEWEMCKDVQGLEVDCCENKNIPIADYCKDERVVG